MSAIDKYNDLVKRMESVTNDRFGSDGSEVKFFYDGVFDEGLSNEMGRPIYKLVEMIEVKIPGRTSSIVTDVKPDHIKTYSSAYKAFKSQLKQSEDGTLLQQWTLLPKDVQLELSSMGISTVEELVLSKDLPVMEFYSDWVEKAETWIKESSEAKNLLPGLKKTLKDQIKKIEKLEEQIILLQRQVKGES